MNRLNHNREGVSVPFNILTWIIVIFSLLTLLLTTSIAGAQEVVFPDSNLEAAIREAIGKPTGKIDEVDLVGLTTLDAENRGISELSGLEYCTDLTWLNLNDNNISNLSPLTNLTGLQVVSRTDG